MFTLGQKQEIFSEILSKFILELISLGYKVRMGQVSRTPEQQEIYIKKGLSKTKNSNHLVNIAADLNLFYNGEYLNGDTIEEVKLLHKAGVIWERLCKEVGVPSDWGGRYKVALEDYEDDTKLGWDSNHFAIKQ